MGEVSLEYILAVAGIAGGIGLLRYHLLSREAKEHNKAINVAKKETPGILADYLATHKLPEYAIRDCANAVRRENPNYEKYRNDFEIVLRTVGY